MNIGITGHQKLNDQSLWDWVKSEFKKVVNKYDEDLIGVSSLAVGADQIFADTVLDNGGRLQIVVPFEGYELKFDRGEKRENYFRLLHSAAFVEVLDKRESEEAGYFAAGKRVVEMSDLLIAVWNGAPAAGLGGTGDVVEFAVRNNKKIIHINPETKSVTEIMSDIYS